MIGILLITHNGLGDSLVDCVQHVYGHVPPNLKALPVRAGDNPQHKEDEARALIAQLDKGEGVLLLSDVFGATPCNIARKLCEPGRVEGIAGVNLPMLLRALCYRSKPLSEIAHKALEGARECIIPMASDMESCNVATACADN